MRLVILGKTKDDKGTQLEELTKKILAYQGFKDIVPNEQVAGGSEIDINAKKEILAGIDKITVSVICECKAHGTPITMTDWLKFIGKVTIARKTTPNSIGLMLALSGANGAVMGSFHTDFANDKSIQLIANDDLVLLVSTIYCIPDENVIRDRLLNTPSPTVNNVVLLYYRNQFWWLLSFPDERFTLCGINGDLLKKNEVVDILLLIEKSTEYSQTKYVDLWETIELAAQMKHVDSIVITTLAKDGNGSIADISKHIVNAATGKQVEEDIIIKAIEQNPFVVHDTEKKTISLKNDEDICFSDFYRYVLLQGAPVELLGTDYYQSHINDNLLEEIWGIQFNFKIEEKKIPEVLFLLKHSPSALLYAVTPDRILQGYKTIGGINDMDTLYQAHFMSELTNRFIDNYYDQNLHQLYLDVYKIDKVSISSTIDVLCDSNIYKFEANKNFALAKLTGSDQVIMLVAKDGVNTPENKKE